MPLCEIIITRRRHGAPSRTIYVEQQIVDEDEENEGEGEKWVFVKYGTH